MMALISRSKSKFLSIVSKFLVSKRHRINILDSVRMVEIGQKIYLNARQKILFGPFVDVEIPPSIANYSNSFRAGWILGTFEQQLQTFLTSKRWNLIVNLGAAEGYYPVCMLAKNLGVRAITFESAEKERESLKEFSETNGVRDRIEIHGLADRHFASYLPSNLTPGNNLIIVDIEGAEFDLFDSEMLELLREYHIVMEVHEFVAKNGDQVKSFINVMREFYDIQILNENTRTFPNRIELPYLTRQEAFLVGAEERAYDMFWLIATPRNVG